MSPVKFKVDAVHNKDCIAGMRRLADGVIDLAFADPPFNIGYDYDVYDDRRGDDEFVSWCRDWMSEVVRLLKPERHFLAGHWRRVRGRSQGADAARAAVELPQLGRVVLHVRRQLQEQVQSLARALVPHGEGRPRTSRLTRTEIRVPSARQLVYGDSRANPQGRLPDDTWILRPQDLPEGFQPLEDTWYFPRVAGTFKERAGFHGCQMPEQLLGRIVRACSHSGEIVLDPFAGSGTTLAVAKKLGRRYLGFELSAEYTRLIKGRLRGIRPGDPLDGAPSRWSVRRRRPPDAQLDSRVHGQHPRRTRGPSAGQKSLPGLD